MTADEHDVRFDTALPLLASLLLQRTDLDLSADGYFLRDGFGRVAFFATKNLSAKTVRDFNTEAKQTLGGHAFITGALQLAEQGPTASNAVLWKSLAVGGREWSVQIVDRRLVGRDWLTRPVPIATDLPPILTFGSLKGGVGRSTALFILAAYLARQGRNVLLIDLDLEAPGLASLVFEPGEEPAFGALEYLVESRLREIEASELHKFVATSSLTDRIGGHGRVDLLPATGSETIAHPHTMMAKLARALVETPSKDGPVLLSTQIAQMVARFAKASEYDAILVDARAGLAELTAAPLLGLGGSVVLFGTDQRHTFEGYRYLCAHLGLLAAASEGEEWRDRLHFVHAKASARPDRIQGFDDELYEVLADTLYDRDDGECSFTFSLDDDLAPHKSWVIYHDAQFLDAGYVGDPEIFDSPLLMAVFGDFLARATETLGAADEELNQP